MVSQVFQAVDHFDQTYQHYKQCCVESQHPGTQDVEVIYQRCTESYRQVKQEGRSLLGKASNLSSEARKVVSKFLSTLKEKRHVQKKQAQSLPSSSSALVQSSDPNLELPLTYGFIAKAKEQCNQLGKALDDWFFKISDPQYREIKSIYKQVYCKAGDLFRNGKMNWETFSTINKRINNGENFIEKKYTIYFVFSNNGLLQELKRILDQLTFMPTERKLTQSTVNNAIDTVRSKAASLHAEAAEFLAEQRKIAESIVI